MKEIRFHGRGGQGTVVASIVMAKACFAAGWFVQSFPVFGVERRGAPVEAYLRLDRSRIWVRSNVYTPDHVVVQDLRLLDTVDITRGLKPGGWIVLNSAAMPAESTRFAGYRLALVDATRIAQKHRLGSPTQPMINTAMIGAASRAFEMPPFGVLSDVIRDEIPSYPERNIAAATEAYDTVDRIGPIE